MDAGGKMSTMVMKHRRFHNAFTAAILALVVPSIALADTAVCPPTSPTQPVQFTFPIPEPIPNDPTPIIIDLFSTTAQAVDGVTLVGAPDAAATAVSDGTSMVIRTVAPTAPDVPSDPIIALTVIPDQPPPDPSTTSPADGGTAPTDPGSSCVPNSGGSTTTPVAITDVLPGGGLLPAGSVVAVVGSGFQPGAAVVIEGVSLASTSVVDSSRIEVVTAADTQLDGKLVTVTNPDLTGATYLSYLRGTDLGKSATPLLAATSPIFPVQTLSSAVFAAPTGGTFFGFALQNPGPGDSVVSIDLWDGGSVVASASIALPALTKVSREASELFPGVVPGAQSFFALTASAPVQMLGLSGNENDGSVTPVLPALASP